MVTNRGLGLGGLVLLFWGDGTKNQGLTSPHKRDWTCLGLGMPWLTLCRLCRGPMGATLHSAQLGLGVCTVLF